MNNEAKAAIKSLCYHINGSYVLAWDNIDDESMYIINTHNKEIICKVKAFKKVCSPMDASYYLYFHNKKYRAIANGITDPNLRAVIAGDGYKFNWPNHVVKFIEKVVNIADDAKEEPIMMKWEVKTPDMSINRANTTYGVLTTLMKNFAIEDVIFNNPATIVKWSDGTKTVVKAENEEFDPEKGLAMAICKRMLGNKYDYYDIFKKYVGRYEKKQKKGKK